MATGAEIDPLERCICKCVNCFDQCLFPFKDAIAQRLTSLIKLEENWTSLQTAISQLNADEIDLQTELSAEDTQGKIPACRVHLWQQQLSALLQNYATIQTEYDNSKQCCYCCCKCSLSLSQTVSEKLKVAQRLLRERYEFRYLAYTRPADTSEVKSTGSLSSGMDSVMRQLRDHFNDRDKTIIGIHGVGGVGKTTLLKAFNNKLRSNSEYQVVIYIVVSNSNVLNVTDIQRKIARRLGLPWNDGESEELRTEQLHQELLRKRFVVLLDDVRREFDLETVKRWGKEPAWELFMNNLSDAAIDTIQKDIAIREYATSIFERCEGLPLALAVIGKAVAVHADRESWKA